MPPRYGGSSFGYGGAAWPGGRGRGGQHRQDPALLGVAIALLQQIVAMPNKPPVTLALLALNVLAFLRPEGFDFVPSIRQGCLHPVRILRNREWSRLLWGPLLHADHMHLFYNMSSLLWKGAQLEPRYGAVGFAKLVASLAFLSNVLYVGLAAGLSSKALWSPHSPAGAMGAGLMRSCAVGFSGVLFGLKVVLNWNSPGWSNVYGVVLPTKYVCWAELLLMQLLVPDASFFGHLCGILAGIIHVAVLPRLLPMLGWAAGRGGSGGRRRGGGGGRTYGHGTWGGGSAQKQQQQQAGNHQTSPLVTGKNSTGGPGSKSHGSGSSGARGAGLDESIEDLLTAAQLAAATTGPGQSVPKQQLRQRRRQQQGEGSRSGGSQAPEPSGSRDGRKAEAAQAGSRARATSSRSLRLAAAVTVYALLAAAWATNPHPFSSWGRWGLGAAPGPLHKLGWLAAKAGLGYRLVNLQLLSLLETPSLSGGGGGRNLHGGSSTWYVGAFGGWHPLPAPLGALAAACVAAAELMWQHGPWFLRHVLRFVWDCLTHMLPATRALEVVMCLLWLLWQLPALRPALMRYTEARPGQGSLLRQAPALLLANVSHASSRHLLLNMLFLALVGGPAEQVLGPSRLVLWFLGGGAAVLASLHMQRRLTAWLAACWRRLTMRWRRSASQQQQQLKGALAGVKGAEPGLYLLMAVALERQALSNLVQVLTYGSGVIMPLLSGLGIPEESMQNLLLAWNLASQLWLQGTALASSAVLLVCGRIAAEQLLLPLSPAALPPPHRASNSGSTRSSTASLGMADKLSLMFWRGVMALLRAMLLPVRAVVLLPLRSALLPATAPLSAARWLRRNFATVTCLAVVAGLAGGELLLMLAAQAAASLEDSTSFALLRLLCVLVASWVLAANAWWRLVMGLNQV